MNNNKGLYIIIVEWLMLIIGMILHFNYHVGKIFYGIDIVRPGADGTISVMSYVLKNVFYHLPMIFILLLLYINNSKFRLAMFVVSIIYSFYHLTHLLKEINSAEFNWAQFPLLTIVLIISLCLNKSSWDYYKLALERD
mgnify:CR=1 FL=1